MITKERRTELRKCWAAETGSSESMQWRWDLTGEELDMVMLWDRIHQDELDRVARSWWAARAREGRCEG